MEEAEKKKARTIKPATPRQVARRTHGAGGIQWWKQSTKRKSCQIKQPKK